MKERELAFIGHFLGRTRHWVVSLEVSHSFPTVT